MKTMKKLFALLLVAAMCMALSVTAFAGDDDVDPSTDPAPTTKKTITLEGGKANHTYTLYQIFTGKVDGNELINIQWGADANDTFKGAYATAAAAAKDIADDNDARASAAEWVENGYLGSGTENKLTADGSVTFSDLDEGYYLIVDSGLQPATPIAEGDYDSAFIVKVVKDVTGKLKGSGASSDKSIKDKDQNLVANEKDAAAWNIGDDVPFQLSATTSDTAATYHKYHITFQDKQSAGLDAPAAYTINVLGHEFKDLTADQLTAGQTFTTANGTKITVSSAAPETGYTFAIKVEFEPAGEGVTDATLLNAEVTSATITVDYTAKLNDNAAVGDPGNSNDMHITYSNNPDDKDGGDEGKTPEDTVVVFTFKPVIDKIDETGAPLSGAAFTIYQEVASGTTGSQLGSDIKAALGTTVKADALENTKYYVAKVMTTTNDTTFEFKGLADGNYVLVETQIPTGYNAFDSVAFTIASEVTESGITTLTGGGPFKTTNPASTSVEKENGDTHTLVSGELFGEVENNSGAVMPETGGIGTKIFYTMGAVLVIGAGVVLVSRKRAGE